MKAACASSKLLLLINVQAACKSSCLVSSPVLHMHRGNIAAATLPPISSPPWACMLCCRLRRVDVFCLCSGKSLLMDMFYDTARQHLQLDHSRR
jgi:hypothetical protein